MSESLNKQVDRLARFILDADAGYPNRSTGAIDTAMDWINDLRADVERLTGERDEARRVAKRIAAGEYGWPDDHLLPWEAERGQE